MICFLFLFLEQRQYDNAQAEKETMEQALVRAIEHTGEEYKKVITAEEEQKKSALEKAFFESLYVFSGVFGNEEQQGKLRMYLPLLILAEADGIFLLSMQEITGADGTTELRHVWSEKVFYEYEESYTEEQKKNEVADVLEQNASEAITNHNYIAGQYGISYSFFVPDFLQNTKTSLEFPMIIAVFQGWPLTASGKLLYDNCLDGGVYLQKVTRYVVTGPEGLHQANCCYHNQYCPVLIEKRELVLKENLTEAEAVLEFGALPCKECVFFEEDNGG